MRILICGDRNWIDREKIAQQLRIIKKVAEWYGWKAGPEAPIPWPPVVIHGAARGADTIAGEEAKKLGFEVKAYPAEWQSYGRAAGPVRNEVMLTDGAPDLVLAFHSNLAESKGTAHMVKIARAAGVPTEVIQ
jgi:hypothetical protein